MPSFSRVSIEDYEPLYIMAANLVAKIHYPIKKFYPFLKKIALSGNESAILFRAEIRGNDEYTTPTAIMEKIHFFIKILKKLHTIKEFTDFITDLTPLVQVSADYLNRFNTEFAVEGSGIEKIVYVHKELYQDDNFDSVIYNYDSMNIPIKVCPFNLSDEDRLEAVQEGNNIGKRNVDMIWGSKFSSPGPRYAIHDLIEYDIISYVRSIFKIKRALTNGEFSPEEIENLSKEFHYNNIIINTLRNFSFGNDYDSDSGYDS